MRAPRSLDWLQQAHSALKERTRLKPYLKLRLAIFLNRLRRRKGPAFRDQCAAVIMRMCSLQLERGEFRELAPVKNVTGPMKISGGAITTITYQVFDPEADKLDKKIRLEPWRAFAQVTMRLTIERDPEFEVKIDGSAVEPRDCHKAPGVALVQHLSTYFPILPKTYIGPVFTPEVA